MTEIVKLTALRPMALGDPSQHAGGGSSGAPAMRPGKGAGSAPAF